MGSASFLISLPQETCIGGFATSLGGRSRGQIHNAELASEKLDGAVIGAHDTFSFNARVGSFSRDQGYRKAPVSYNGQLITDWGGGVCQVSTTLYNAALLSGMTIIERNRHRFCPSYVAPGRDAAVAFSNIDLRFANPHPFPVRILARVVDGLVRVEIVGAHALPNPPRIVSELQRVEAPLTFRLGTVSAGARVRNSGKPGYEVAIYRLAGSHHELISQETYPAMNRVVQYGDGGQ